MIMHCLHAHVKNNLEIITNDNEVLIKFDLKRIKY